MLVQPKCETQTQPVYKQKCNILMCIEIMKLCHPTALFQIHWMIQFNCIGGGGVYRYLVGRQSAQLQIYEHYKLEEMCKLI